jgi:hypothetical protein
MVVYRTTGGYFDTPLKTTTAVSNGYPKHYAKQPKSQGMAI